MHEYPYKYSIILIFSFASVVFVLLFFISAPYGKFSRKGWGPQLKSKWAWMIMEFPSPCLMLFFFITSDIKNLPQIIFLYLMADSLYSSYFYLSFHPVGQRKALSGHCLHQWRLSSTALMDLSNGYGVFNIYNYNLSWIFTMAVYFRHYNLYNRIYNKQNC